MTRADTTVGLCFCKDRRQGKAAAGYEAIRVDSTGSFVKLVLFLYLIFLCNHKHTHINCSFKDVICKN